MPVIRFLSGLFVCLLAFALPAATYAADAAPTLSIPLLNQEPELSDFAGMSPSTALARQMAKMENFVQREPTDGAPASQRTEVYLGYDQRALYAVFLAFDTDPSRASPTAPVSTPPGKPCGTATAK